MFKLLVLVAATALTGCAALTPDPESGKPRIGLRMGDVACSLKVKPDESVVRCVLPFGGA